MANKLYEESSIQDIANAIREKTGGTDTYLVAQMGDAIRDIPSGEQDIQYTDILRLPGTVIHYGYGRNKSGLVTVAGCITVDFDLNEVMGDYTKQQSFVLRWINAYVDGSYGNVWTSQDKTTWYAMLYMVSATGMLLDEDSFYTPRIPNSYGNNRRYVSITLRLTAGSEINEKNVHVCILTLGEKIGKKQIPTQFTNLLDLPTTEVHRYYSFDGNALVAHTANTAIKIKISPTDDCIIRIRSILSLSSVVPYIYACDTSDGKYRARCAWYQAFSYDEYGDIALNVTEWVKNQGFEYIVLNFRTDQAQFNDIDDFGIITLNEPIGNGGYVE